MSSRGKKKKERQQQLSFIESIKGKIPEQILPEITQKIIRDYNSGLLKSPPLNICTNIDEYNKKIEQYANKYLGKLMDEINNSEGIPYTSSI